MGTFLAVFFMREQDLVKIPTILLIFITYFSGYLYTKYQNSGKLFYKILLFNVVSGIISAILIISNHNEVRLVKWAVIVILGLLYDSWFLKNYVRQIPLFKVFYVGFTWAMINSWLIIPEFNLEIFVITLLYITALVLPFDIRDMQSDTVTTFPKIIGIQKTKYLAYLFCAISAVLAIQFLKIDFAIAYFVSIVFSFILIYFSNETRKDSYFSFLVETCAGLPFLIYVLMQYF
ncbi:UbiA prenyltransferase family protein [Frigoriflavimonas asaccharolytica]|uniref:UbiA prenyltransferase family protein n=1 Tax=Frigoriflavimonas asaccharolytica TaxID=2735899 RepID=A0A8J8G4T2_9FLAO|nr:hypothetical protein [Frigoriflavimonas asaccharolytica]NRS91269.1 hypothetical protein [Frigoriflavimonas asaccharolytica]